jgi:hypothetical protein
MFVLLSLATLEWGRSSMTLALDLVPHGGGRIFGTFEGGERPLQNEDCVMAAKDDCSVHL